MSSKKKFVKKESSTPPAAPAPAAVPAPAPAPAAYRTPAYLTRVAPALMAVFFLGTCMTSGSSQKVVTLLVMAAAIFPACFGFPTCGTASPCPWRPFLYGCW